MTTVRGKEDLIHRPARERNLLLHIAGTGLTHRQFVNLVSRRAGFEVQGTEPVTVRLAGDLRSVEPRRGGDFPILDRRGIVGLTPTDESLRLPTAHVAEPNQPVAGGMDADGEPIAGTNPQSSRFPALQVNRPVRGRALVRVLVA